MPETQHGGRRTGSGRKPQGEVAMVTNAFVIRQDQMDMIVSHAAEAGLNRSEWLRRLIDLYADDC